MTIKTMQRVWVSLLIAAGAAVAAPTGVPLSTAEMAEQVTTAQAQACGVPAGAPRSASAAEDRAMRQAQSAHCACMTRSLQAWVDSGPQVTRWAAIAAVNTMVDTCAARNIRELVAAFCDAGLDPLNKPGEPSVGETDRRARCQCLQDGLGPLTDAELVESASASYRDFRAKVQARVAGTPDPAPTPSPFEIVRRTCSAPAPQR